MTPQAPPDVLVKFENYLHNIMRQLDYHVELIDKPEALVNQAREDAAKANPTACIVYALCLLKSDKSLHEEALRCLTRAAEASMFYDAAHSNSIQV